MTLDPRHYVPVLKVKRGEKKALTLLSASVQSKVIPLLEIVERKNKTVPAHLDTAFKGLAAAAQPFGRCFIDAREIEPDGPAAATMVFQRATSDGIAFTPVTGISRISDVASALAHQANGVALRLTRMEFEAGNLRLKMQHFMRRHGLAPEMVDLIVDLGAVDTFIREGVEHFTGAFLGAVPDHTRWRTFTLSACAFPPGLGGINRNSDKTIDRVDWLAWRDGLHARRHSLTRLPSYSDGVIQHPKGVEGFDFRTMRSSAAIRYAVADSWLCIKGESIKTTRSSVQFPALACRLVYGHLVPHFHGPNHCSGCESMKAVADGVGGFGSQEAWRRLGTIHHITTVVEELAALP